MADPIWELKFRGEPVSIALEDLTRHRMREVGAALGDEYRIPSDFIMRLLRGDMDAIAGALWVHGQVIGKPIGDMLELDFSNADFAAPDRKLKRPGKGTAAATSAQTTSPETPSSSETDS